MKNNVQGAPKLKLAHADQHLTKTLYADVSSNLSPLYLKNSVNVLNKIPFIIQVFHLCKVHYNKLKMETVVHFFVVLKT